MGEQSYGQGERTVWWLQGIEERSYGVEEGRSIGTKGCDASRTVVAASPYGNKEMCTK